MAAVAIGCVALPGGATQVMVSRPPAPVIFVDEAHPLIVGSVIGEAERHADRAELLVTARARPSAAENTQAAAELEAGLRAAFPGVAIHAQPTTYILPSDLNVIDNAAAVGAWATVPIPAPLDNATIDERLQTLARVGGASIADVALAYDDACAALNAATRADAAGFATSQLTALKIESSLTLVDRSADPVGGRPDPLCGPEAHARLYPLGRRNDRNSASYHEHRAFTFVASGAPTISAIAEPITPDVSGSAGSDAEVTFRTAGATLTVSGASRFELAPTYGRYVYRGPGRAGREFDAASARAAVHRRLRAAGVAEEDIFIGRGAIAPLYVEVRTARTAPDEAIVGALTSDDPRGHQVLSFLPSVSRCVAEPAAFARAFLDARARATRLAAAMKAAVGRPIFVQLGAGTPARCHEPRDQPYDDAVQRGDPGARVASYAAVRVTFAVTGALQPPQRHDTDYTTPDSNGISRWALALGTWHYSRGGHVDDVRLESSLPATGYRIDIDLSMPPQRVMTPSHLASRVASALGIEPAEVHASAELGPDDSGGTPAHVTAYGTAARVMRGLAALEDFLAPLRGFVQLVPQRSECTGAADDLALAAIADGAARGSRPIVAIEVQGPVALRGTCSLGPGGTNGEAPSRNPGPIAVGVAVRVVREGPP